MYNMLIIEKWIWL